MALDEVFKERDTLNLLIVGMMVLFLNERIKNYTKKF